jgi:hypothetical protein
MDDGSDPRSALAIPAPVEEALPAMGPDEIDTARSYADASKAASTRRAYASDWRRFDEWCRQRGVDPLPADPHPYLTRKGVEAHGLRQNRRGELHLVRRPARFLLAQPTNDLSFVKPAFLHHPSPSDGLSLKPRDQEGGRSPAFLMIDQAIRHRQVVDACRLEGQRVERPGMTRVTTRPWRRRSPQPRW